MVPLAASALFVAGPHRIGAIVAAMVALFAADSVLLLDNKAEYNDFKAIYAPLHTPDARILASVNSPRGDYALLDDFTERVDTDIPTMRACSESRGRREAMGFTGTATASLPCRETFRSGLAMQRQRWTLSPTN